MARGLRLTTGLVLTVAALLTMRAPLQGAPLSRAQNPQKSQNPLFLRVADAAAGKAIFASKCAACHNIAAGATGGFGPNLLGLFGRRAGSVAGYDYSNAMKKSQVVWNAKSLDAFLADQEKVIPGTKMPPTPISNKTERQNLIAYLEQATH